MPIPMGQQHRWAGETAEAAAVSLSALLSGSSHIRDVVAAGEVLRRGNGSGCGARLDLWAICGMDVPHVKAASSVASAEEAEGDASTCVGWRDGSRIGRMAPGLVLWASGRKTRLRHRPPGRRRFFARHHPSGRRRHGSASCGRSRAGSAHRLCRHRAGTLPGADTACNDRGGVRPVTPPGRSGGGRPGGRFGRRGRGADCNCRCVPVCRRRTT